MKKKLIVIGLSIVTLFGCASNQNPKINAVGSMGDISIVPGSIKAGPGINSLLMAQAVLKNNGSKTITAFYRCKFFDLNGMQVGDDQVWQQITLYTKATQSVKCMATEKEAADFQLEFSANGSNVNAFQ